MSLEEKPCRMGSCADLISRPRAQQARSLVIAASLAALAAATSGEPAAAAEPSDPDWPCVQRLVPALAASQMWAGPAAEAGEVRSSPDGEVAQLAHRLASRSTPADEAQAAIDRFADDLAPEERNQQLAQLFHDVLQQINQERSQIIAGIKRYTRKQQHLAEKISQDSQRLADLQPGTTPDAQTQELLDARQWDLRVFEDRQRILTHICEQPVLLEQRAFSLSRAMQARLEPN
jgi:hypothetical protein